MVNGVFNKIWICPIALVIGQFRDTTIKRTHIYTYLSIFVEWFFSHNFESVGQQRHHGHHAIVIIIDCNVSLKIIDHFFLLSLRFILTLFIFLILVTFSNLFFSFLFFSCSSWFYSLPDRDSIIAAKKYFGYWWLLYEIF